MRSPHLRVILGLLGTLAVGLGLYSWTVLGLWPVMGAFAFIFAAWLVMSLVLSLVVVGILALTVWWVTRNLLERNRK